MHQQINFDPRLTTCGFPDRPIGYGQSASCSFDGESVPRHLVVRAAIDARQARFRHFSINLFSDPAWDILLKLYRFELASCKIVVSDLIFATSIPPSTALRWISILEAKELVCRTGDPTDRRRVYLRLSPTGTKAMDDYFQELS